MSDMGTLGGASSFFGDAPAPEDKPVLPQGVVDADAPEEAAYDPNTQPVDANPYRAAGEVESILTTAAGLDPGLASFVSGRVRDALNRPEPNDLQKRASNAAARNTLIARYGNVGALKVYNAAVAEYKQLATSNPKLHAILNRAGMMGSVQLADALAKKNIDRQTAIKLKAMGITR